MSTTLSSRSKASIVVGIAVLAVVAGLAITTGGGDDSVVFSNAAQAQAQDGQGGDPQGRPCPGRGGPLGHAIHGELIVPEPPEDESEQAGEEPDEDAEPTFRNVVLDAGEVTAISDDSISLERPDGEEVTVGLTDDTKMREAPEEGDRAVVVADEDGNALRVMYRPEGEGEGQGEGQGEGDRPCGPPRGQGPEAGQGPQGFRGQDRGQGQSES